MIQRTKHITYLMITVALIGLLVAFALYMSNNQRAALYYGNYDMCQLRMATNIAQYYGARYRLDSSFDTPMIIITADKNTLDNISANYKTITEATINNKACHLHHVKYHAEYVNAKLLPHIPDDIDYISYAPPSVGEHKAVYCYYDFRPKQDNSKCYFVKLDERFNIVTTDDISDIERFHIKQIENNYKHFDNHTHHSYVAEWRNQDNLYYGMYFATKNTYSRFGYGGFY